MRRTRGHVRTGARFIALAMRGAIEVLLALVILFEEWGWRPLAALLARLGHWRPWAIVEAVIADLPPHAALVAFALPTALFFPLKLLALLLIAKGQTIAAGALFIAAKAFGTALVARIFQLTQPALMRIAWFAWAYSRYVPWRDTTLGIIRSTWIWRHSRIVKTRAAKAARNAWARARPHVAAAADNLVRKANALFGRSPMS